MQPDTTSYTHDDLVRARRRFFRITLGFGPEAACKLSEAQGNGGVSDGNYVLLPAVGVCILRHTAPDGDLRPSPAIDGVPVSTLKDSFETYLRVAAQPPETRK